MFLFCVDALWLRERTYPLPVQADAISMAIDFPGGSTCYGIPKVNNLYSTLMLVEVAG